MRRVFELEEVLDDGGVMVVPFDGLEQAQQEPWGEGTAYRVIAEMEVPARPLMESLVLNVWHQSEPEAEWHRLD